MPLPTAAADHQTTNAVTLERAGAAIHIPQAHFTVERLDATIRRLLERPEELQELQRLGCQVGQGYYFAKPMAAGDMAAYLENFAAEHAA